MRRPRIALVVALALLAATPAISHAAASRAELEERVVRLERLVDNQGLMELARQVDQLQDQVRTLRGDLDELQHSVELGKAQQRAQYLDLDKRLKALEDNAAKLAQATAAATPDPAAEYQAAFDLLKASKYDQARAGFQAFLTAHPQDDLAPNAQYWLGEIAYVGRDYEAALAAFRKVVSDYPGARKAPDATLKAGYCLYELKRYPEAKATLVQVTDKYPDSAAARDAAARLSQMASEGH